MITQIEAAETIDVLAPETPTVPTFSSSSSPSNTFQVEWGHVDYSTGYELQRSFNGGGFVTIFTGSSRSISQTLSRGDYLYRVRACRGGFDDQRCGAWTDVNGGESDGNAPMITVNAATDEENSKFGEETADSSTGSYEPDPHSQQPDQSFPTAVPYGSDTVGTTSGQFRVNESGGSSYSIPIATPAGVAGVRPDLSLNYNSHAGNGLLGKGWTIGGISAVTRCRQTMNQDGQSLPLDWSSTDRFCLNGQRLVVTSGSYGSVGSEYHTEIDNYSVINAVGGVAGNPDYFKVSGKDGSVVYYGTTDASRLVKDGDTSDTSDTPETYSWGISESQDSVGNAITYDYDNDDDGHRITKISYGNNAAVIAFEYEDRKDIRRAYIAGGSFVAAMRLAKVTTTDNGQELRQYHLDYAGGNDDSTSQNVPTASRLVSVQECNGSICLPKTTFDWQLFETSRFGTHDDGSNNLQLDDRHYLIDQTFADINGDGLQDLIYVTSYYKIKKRFLSKPKVTSHQSLNYMINTGNGFDHGVAVRYPDKIENPLELRVIDYNADGRQDLLVYHNDENSSGTWDLFLSVASGGGHWALVKQPLTLPFTSRDVEIADLNGDGLVDVAQAQKYWLLERDPSTSGDTQTNLAYGFGGSRNLSMGSNFPNTSGSSIWSGSDPSCLRHCSHYYDSSLKIKASAGDVNGDGLGDFLVEENGYNIALSDGSSDDVMLWPYEQNSSTYPSIADHELFRAVDVNADGLSDIIYWHKGSHQWRLQLSTGAGFGAPQNILYASNADDAEDQTVQIADINRDGYADFIWQEVDGESGYGMLKVRYWGKSGNEEFSSTSDLKSVYIDDKTNHIILDYNGDGAADYVKFKGHSGGHGGIFYYNSSGDSADGLWDATRNVGEVISTITNGLGAKTQIRYEHLNQTEHYTPVDTVVLGALQNDHSAFNDPFSHLSSDTHTLQPTPVSPVLGLNGPLPVVTRVSSSAPLASNPDALSHISYAYAEGRMQALGRGSLGFKTLSTTDEQTGVITTTTYRQDWPFIGSPWKTEVRTGDGHLLKSSENTWKLKGWQDHWESTFATSGSSTLGPMKPYVAKAIETTYSLESNGAIEGDKEKTVTTEIDIDSFGNTTEIVIETYSNSGGVSSGNFVRREMTENTYGSSDYDREKGRLSQSRVTVERGVNSTSRLSEFTYYTTGVKKGLLHTETIQPSGGDDEKLTTTHSYDDNGNKTQRITTGHDGSRIITRSSPRVIYDNKGRYVVSTYQTYPGEGEKRISQVHSRDRYGHATEVSDILGNKVRSQFSPMGRQFSSGSDAGGWQKTYMSASSPQCPLGIAYVVHSEGADGSASQQCHDKIGRPVRTLAKGFDGTWIASDTEYDRIGRVARKSEPFKLHSGGEQAPYWTTMLSYDILGRPLEVMAPDGSISTTEYTSEYNGSTVSITNAHDQTKTETYNVLGEVIQVVDAANSTTAYEYDVQGNLIAMTDSGGNTTTMAYDVLGRKLSMDDPDKGQWSYSYNAFGELISQIDAKGQRTTFEYDALGRKIKRTDYRSNGGEEQRTHWTYDSGANGVGQLASQTISGGSSDGYSITPHYDDFGRHHKTVTAVPGAGEFTGYQTFDALGRPWQQFDASSNQRNNGWRGIETQYNVHGYAHKVVNVRELDGDPEHVYQEIMAMDARGNVTQSKHGDVITTDKQYDYATGLLRSVNSNTALSNIQSLQYAWDEVGNLISRQESSGSKDLKEEFTYDTMNRLIEAGDAWVNYDALGNITAKSDVGNYTYGNNAGPHAVTHAGGVSYAYDANGNNISSSDGRSLTYSTFDKVTEVTTDNHKVSFAYGPNRNRYKRVDEDIITGQIKTTYYVGSVEIVVYESGANSGRMEYRRQLGNALETLVYAATNTPTPEQFTRYLLQDHLGSVDVIVNKLGEIEQELSFDAWGKRRNATDWQAQLESSYSPLDVFGGLNSITSRGYTGHEMVDSVGIIHMNGRIYDPTLGRFLQADPFIQAPYNTQSLNRYSYVLNNPLNATDPSGYFANWLIAAVIGYVVSDIIITIGINSGWSSDLIQVVSFVANCWINACFDVSNLGQSVSNVFSTTGLQMGIIGGITSVLSGGKFGHGFVSAGIAAGGVRPSSSGGSSGSSTVSPQEFIGRTILGGTISKITGGKFANGAAATAFGTMVQMVASGDDKPLDTTEHGETPKNIDENNLRSTSLKITVSETRNDNDTLVGVEINIMGTYEDRTNSGLDMARKAENGWSGKWIKDGVVYELSTTLTELGTDLNSQIRGPDLIFMRGDCNKNYACASGNKMIFDNYEAMFSPAAIAHEFGHNLGFFHWRKGVMSYDGTESAGLPEFYLLWQKYGY